MCYDDNGLIAVFYVVSHPSECCGVKIITGLVKNQEIRTLEQCPCKRYALSFAAGKNLFAASRIAIGEIQNAELFHNRFNARIIGGEVPDSDILKNASVEQIRVLLNKGKTPAPCLQVRFAQLMSADLYAAVVAFKQSAQQHNERRFSASVCPRHRELIPFFNREGHIVENRLIYVSERQPIHPNKRVVRDLLTAAPLTVRVQLFYAVNIDAEQRQGSDEASDL